MKTPFLKIKNNFENKNKKVIEQEPILPEIIIFGRKWDFILKQL